MFQQGIRYAVGVAAAGLAACVLAPSAVRAAEPITIGLGMALTGGLAGGGKSALLAMQIWQDQINAKGGLLGRPVKLIYYDDQSNPATVPGIYTKMLDVDKVDFIISGYGTNQIAPAMPIAIAHDKVFLGLFGLAVNSEFHYPKYFSMLPMGPDPKHANAQPFFDVALAANPKPKTLALLAEDSEFPKTRLGGHSRHRQAKRAPARLRQDLSAGHARFHPDRPCHSGDQPRHGVCRLLPAGFGRDAARRDRIRAQDPVSSAAAWSGCNTLRSKSSSGPSSTASSITIAGYRRQTMQFPGILDFLKEYQSKAGKAGVDPMGWYLPPFAYADLQVLGDAITGANSLDQDKVADYIRSHPFKTIVGDITFGKDGEWSKSRVLEVQWQNIKSNSLDQFKDTKTEVILEPSQYRTGTVVAPYDGGSE